MQNTSKKSSRLFAFASAIISAAIFVVSSSDAIAQCSQTSSATDSSGSCSQVEGTVQTTTTDESLVNVESFKQYIDEFNRVDQENITNTFPNASALDWMVANVPRFECPDKLMKKTYYFC